MKQNNEFELSHKKKLTKWLKSIPLLYLFACFTSLITYAGIKTVFSVSGKQVISDNFILTICVVVTFVVTTTVLYLSKPKL